MTTVLPDTALRPLSHRDVLAIAIPIMLSNVTTPLVGAVDTAVIGQSGDAAMMGGVAVGAQLFEVLFWTFGFLRMGTSGLTAQAKGAGFPHEIAATLERALIVALGLGAIMVALQWPIGSVSLWLIGGSDAVQKAAHVYFTWRIWGAPFTFCNYALLGWFVGQGEAGRAFLIQLLLNVTNAALSILFVIGLHQGVAGAGAAALAAEIIAALVGLVAAGLQIRARGGRASRDVILAGDALRRLFAVNADIMIRTLCLVLAFTYFTALGARQGDLVLAANGVLGNLFGIASYFLDGFAHAAETFVGQAIGAGRRARLLQAVRLSSLWAGVVSLGLSLLLWIFGGMLIDLMTTSPDVRIAAREYLPWCAASPIVGFAAFQLDGIFIGATRGPDMRNMMLLSSAVFLLLTAVLTPALGNHGLWLALILFFITRGVALASRFPALLREAFG